MKNLKARLMQVRKDKELLEEEEKRIKREIVYKRIPSINVGQVYKFPYSGDTRSLVMVACLEGTVLSGVGLTLLGDINHAGCYNHNVLRGTISKQDMRELLVKKNAEYLGTFQEVYKRIN